MEELYGLDRQELESQGEKAAFSNLGSANLLLQRKSSLYFTSMDSTYQIK